MSLAEKVATAFGHAKKSTNGYQCTCPCHDDKSASLGVTDNPSGGVVFNCLAGCDWKDIQKVARERRLVDDFKKTPTTKATPIVYRYLYANGQECCQKLRYPDKRFYIQRFDEQGNVIKSIKGISVPLYNLPAIINAEVIYLCEGEKDADNLIRAGLAATTNIAGATSWNNEYNQYFKGKTVIICEDNDDAGRARTKKITALITTIAKELRIFAPAGLPEKGDVTDWINAGGKPEEIFKLSTAIGTKPKQKKATRDQYFELFETVLNNPKKCIFNEKLMTLTSSGLWNPAVNYLDILKSEAAVMNEGDGPKFSLSLIQSHFFSYEASKEPEFVVEIPEWDQQDRISEMAYLMKLKPSSEVTETALSELLKEWCALMFQRLYDPMIQNRILVLQGGQGIGKDTWVSMLVDGLGQFAVPLAVVKEDKDTYLNLHRGLVMKISEFDKTAKAEVSTLKDIITAPSTNLRSPYDRDARVRYSRCSFISSANIENLLRDYTGNRRFMIFEIEKIEYAYKGWSKEQIQSWQMQVLAEAQHLAKIKYTASAEAHQQMDGYIENETPSDPADDMVQEFLGLFNRDLNFMGKSEVTEAEVLQIRHELKRVLGVNVRGIAAQLRRKIGSLRRAADGTRYWVYKIPSATNVMQ
jgi:hypothetical protein